ncbi:MAG: rhodanese-like domain-containing protein, partial [Burkholderiaceae bacterium]
MMSVVVGLAGLLVSQWAFAQAATIAVGTPLKILDGQPEQITVKTAKGSVTITRKMTACGKNGGVMQPVVPVKGVHPVAEIEIIAALGDAGSVVVDMRDTNDRVKGTIPGSIGIPYTEVASRLNELGCTKAGAKWNCAKAKKVYAFCNGPACPQSPMAIRAMTRDGFPADKIYYYRGGMLDWDALGL